MRTTTETADPAQRTTDKGPRQAGARRQGRAPQGSRALGTARRGPGGTGQHAASGGARWEQQKLHPLASVSVHAGDQQLRARGCPPADQGPVGGNVTDGAARHAVGAVHGPPRRLRYGGGRRRRGGHLRHARRPNSRCHCPPSRCIDRRQAVGAAGDGEHGAISKQRQSPSKYHKQTPFTPQPATISCTPAT